MRLRWRISIWEFLVLSGAVIALTGLITGGADQILGGAAIAVVGIAGWTVQP